MYQAAYLVESMPPIRRVANSSASLGFPKCLCQRKGQCSDETKRTSVGCWSLARAKELRSLCTNCGNSRCAVQSAKYSATFLAEQRDTQHANIHATCMKHMQGRACTRMHARTHACTHGFTFENFGRDRAFLAQQLATNNKVDALARSMHVTPVRERLFTCLHARAGACACVYTCLRTRVHAWKEACWHAHVRVCVRARACHAYLQHGHVFGGLQQLECTRRTAGQAGHSSSGSSAPQHDWQHTKQLRLPSDSQDSSISTEVSARVRAWRGMTWRGVA